MKVLLISTNHNLLTIGGPESSLLAHYREIFTATDVLVLSQSTPAHTLRLSPTVRIESLSLPVTTLSLRQVWQKAKEILLNREFTKEDCLVVDSTQTILWFFGYLLAKKKHVRWHLTVPHLIPFNTKTVGVMENLIRRWLLARVSSVRVGTKQVATWLVKEVGLDTSRVYNLPPFMDVTEIEEEEASIDLHARYIQYDHIMLSIYKHGAETTLPLMLKATRRLLHQGYHPGLILVGYRLDQATKKLIKRLGISHSVVFRESGVDTLSYLKSADYYLALAPTTGFDADLVKAAIVRLPIITSSTDAEQEVLRASDTTIILPSLTDRALTEKLIYLIRHKNLAGSVATRAWSAVHERKMSVSEYLNTLRNSLF